jgi:hypothetical protein
MNKPVDHYISELLFLHDCVILPDFGGFVGNQQSAKLNNITSILIPPSKQILFNANLKTNDGLLITHVSNQENISQDSAKNEVVDFATQISAKLHSSKVLRIDKIGLFTLGKEGNVIFLQDSTNNYSLDAFGMKATHNKAISRANEVEEKVVSIIQNIRTQNNNPKMFLKVAAVIIPLIALSYLSISQQDKISNIYTQMATLNPFTATEVFTPVTIINADKIIDISIQDNNTLNNQNKDAIDWEKIAKELDEKELTTNKKSNTTKKTRIKTSYKENHYYIIAGAFAKQENAQKMMAKLKTGNYNAEIVEGGIFMRVSYNSFTNKEDAIVALKEIKQENPSAWLLAK